MSTAAATNERTPLLPSSILQQQPQPHASTLIPSAVVVEPTLASSLLTTFHSSYINALVIFVPLGILSAHLNWGPVITFWLNFFAIIPLASLLGFATEELALRTNQTVGGLLNATFGNLVEVLVSVIALKNGLVHVVQSSLLGSILSNMLLVLGFCFLLGGANRSSQEFNATAANTSAALLSIAVLSLLVPAAYVGSVYGQINEIMGRVLILSRATAVILLIIYGLYLLFQLRTHAHLYEESAGGVHEVPTLTTAFALTLLISSTVLVGVNSEYLVDSIEGLARSWKLSDTFVGLVLLPIVGNAAEHMSAVTCAMKNKMDLSLGIAVGSSLQIALLVTPFMVVFGWMIGQPMTFFFQLFDTAVLFISVLIVNYLIQDGHSNWLEGAMLLAAYCIIAIAYYMMP